MREEFGEVRGGLDGAPTRERFDAIVAHVERARAQAPARCDVELLPYLEGRLRSWPAAARRAPARWFDRWLYAEPDEGFAPLRLAAALPCHHVFLGRDELERMARAPELANIRRLDLHGNRLRDEGLEVLVASGFLARLEALSMSANLITDDGLAALASAPGLEALRELELVPRPRSAVEGEGFERNRISARGVRALARSSSLSGLRALAIDGEDAALEPLWSEPPALGSLERLSLSGLSEARALGVLARSALAPQLRALELGSPRVTDTGLEALAMSPALSGLEELSVRGDRVRSRGLRALSRASFAPGLTSLEVPGANLGDLYLPEGALQSLRRLDLSSGHVHTRQQLDALLESGALDGLEDLSLANNAIDLDGFVRIGRRADLSGLRRLRLGGTPIHVRHLRALAPSGAPALGALALRAAQFSAGDVRGLWGWLDATRLRRLDLSHNPIGDEGARALAAEDGPTGLRELGLSMSNHQGLVNLGAEGIEALAGAPFVPALRRLDLSEQELAPGQAVGLLQASLGRLERLGLRGCGLGPADAEALAHNGSVRGLERLDLSFNAIGERGLRALADSAHMEGLQVLLLDYNDLSPSAQDFAALGQAPMARSLRVLGMSNTEFGPDGLDHMIAGGRLGPHLLLDLCHTEILEPPSHFSRYQWSVLSRWS